MHSSILTCEPYFGISPAIRRAKEYIDIAVAEPCTVLLFGETGSGKGVAARYIHEQSVRRRRAFVDINCSAGLKGELLKTALFGHTRGAFTDAVNDRPGLMEEANGGTLFLDEIGDMDIDVQRQLLKSIEEKTYRRLGENKMRSSDFRLICATNRNLQEAVKDGTFRADLYHRINTLPINLPPLRERSEDIPGLVQYMLTNMGYDSFPLSEPVANMLIRYPWPGNLRELRNTLERALMFSHKKTLTAEHFPDIENASFDALPDEALPKEKMWDLDRAAGEQIMRALKHFNGDKVKASKELGISLSSLYRKTKICAKRQKTQ